MKKSLVISGGGSKGAWALGWIDFHVKRENNFLDNFNVFVGTSIGALLATGLAVNKFNEMKDLFLKLKNDDVYSVCPFKIKKKTKMGKYELKINFFNVFFNMYIRNSATIGETTKTINLIKKIYMPEDHEKLINSDKELFITTSNINTGELLYVSPKDFDYETFVKFVFSSTCAAPIMSMVEINGNQFVDGGLIENIPIQKAVENENVDEIVVLNLNPKIKKTVWINSPFKLISQYFDVFLRRGSDDDMMIGVLKANQLNKTLKIYSPSKELTDFPFIFDNDDINEFFRIGGLDAFGNRYLGIGEKVFVYKDNNLFYK